MDMSFREGGRSKGDEEMVVDNKVRSIVGRGRTDKGEFLRAIAWEGDGGVEVDSDDAAAAAAAVTDDEVGIVVVEAATAAYPWGSAEAVGGLFLCEDE